MGIIRSIEEGVKTGAAEYEIQSDRREAIHRAVARAGAAT